MKNNGFLVQTDDILAKVVKAVKAMKNACIVKRHQEPQNLHLAKHKFNENQF